MEQTECSETSAFRTKTPGNYPKVIIQHSKHGESLKSKIVLSFVSMKRKQQEKTGQELYLPCHVCVHDLYKKYSCVWHHYSKKKCGTVHQTAMHTWGGTCFDILRSCTEHMHHTDSHKIHIPANKNHYISSPPP